MEIGGSTKKFKSKRHCRVLFNYLPNHDDELFLQVDDIIEIIAEVEEGWWQGRLNGKIGVFPSNFVTEIDYFTSAAVAASAAVVTVNPTSDDKRTNDNSNAAAAATAATAATIGTVDTSITTGGGAALSPATLVASSDDNLTKCTIPKSSGKTICIAKYLYNAKNADELTLREGDLITLLSTETQDKGWWLGEVNGKKGVFPDNFVMLANFDQNSQTFHHRKEFAKNATAAAATIAASNNNNNNTTNYQNNNVAAQRESLQVAGGVAAAAVRCTEAAAAAAAAAGNVTTRLALAQKKSAATFDFDSYDSCGGGSGGGGGIDIRNGSVSHSDSGSGSLRKAFNSELDDVERTILLTDLRASRAKPPKRRPPTSSVLDETSIAADTLVLDHNQNSFLSASEKSNQNENIYDAISEISSVTTSTTTTNANATTISLAETTNNSNSSMNRSSNNSSNASSNTSMAGAGVGVGQPVAESGGAAVAGSLTRNKIKEWEKHKVPWIDELKLNQKTKKIQPPPPPPSSSHSLSPSVATAAAVASPIATSPFGSPPTAAVPAQFTTTTSAAAASTNSNSSLPPEISCSINITVPSFAAPPALFANTYNSNDVVTDSPQKSFSPHLRENVSPMMKPTSKPTRLFPSFSTNNTSSTSDKDNNNESCEDNSQMMLIERSKFENLVNRVSTLETLTTSSFQEFNIVIDEMKAKLEIEKDLRNLLQVQFEKLLHANKMKQI